jgi:hypothetical protein
VPDGVDTDKIEANFKNGVLTVSLPKTPEAQSRRKEGLKTPLHAASSDGEARLISGLHISSRSNKPTVPPIGSPGDL